MRSVKKRHFLIPFAFFITLICIVTLITFSYLQPPTQPTMNIDTFGENALFSEYNEQGKLSHTIQSPQFRHYKPSNNSKSTDTTITIYSSQSPTPWVITADHADHQRSQRILILKDHVIGKNISTSKELETRLSTSRIIYDTQSQIINCPNTTKITRFTDSKLTPTEDFYSQVASFDLKKQSSKCTNVSGRIDVSKDPKKTDIWVIQAKRADWNKKNNNIAFTGNVHFKHIDTKTSQIDMTISSPSLFYNTMTKWYFPQIKPP